MTTKITLKPNCLITRRPLKLVTGPRSLFHYKNPWDILPVVLFEHGYKADLFHLPFRDKTLRQQIFLKNRQQLDHSHIIIDEMTYLEFQEPLKHVKNATITVIGNKHSASKNTYLFDPNYKTWSFAYSLHQKWLQLFGFTAAKPQFLFVNSTQNVWYRFIDHCVTLAELDFLSET